MEQMKLELVEELAESWGCSYEAAYDIVYGAEFICDENETDDAM